MKFKIGPAEVEIDPWLALVFLLFLLLAVLADAGNVLLVYPVLLIGGGMILLAGFVYMILK